MYADTTLDPPFAELPHIQWREHRDCQRQPLDEYIDGAIHIAASLPPKETTAPGAIWVVVTQAGFVMVAVRVGIGASCRYTGRTCRWMPSCAAGLRGGDGGCRKVQHLACWTRCGHSQSSSTRSSPATSSRSSHDHQMGAEQTRDLLDGFAGRGRYPNGKPASGEQMLLAALKPRKVPVLR